ncbi:MAG: hypothetical protein JO161_10615, partial [Planctomycetaceae bacterium]|nr:hypothetical protein [Planctomycetaceae bacterium]
LRLDLHGLLAEGAILEDAWTHRAHHLEGTHLSLELKPRESQILVTPRPS